MKSWYPHTGSMGSWVKRFKFCKLLWRCCGNCSGNICDIESSCSRRPSEVLLECEVMDPEGTHGQQSWHVLQEICRYIYIYIFICKWEHEAMVVYILSKGIFLMPAKMGELRLWMLQPIQTILWTCGNRCSNHRFGSSILWEGSVGMRVTCSDV